jgi:hypothetical protein
VLDPQAESAMTNSSRQAHIIDLARETGRHKHVRATGAFCV